ncbi:hypothetical protein AXF42_Ash006800 [Apostasia shenzhenica]|uniref:Uncharacterized protein n=1 Tax=Apostasia shenzhenica TaxID=1088818 RepID=A0A2I0AJ77_9ASPA|nr:hypothetical protein AXF42_Ash006800 [Apostasia shenzhenica]
MASAGAHLLLILLLLLTTSMAGITSAQPNGAMGPPDYHRITSNHVIDIVAIAALATYNTLAPGRRHPRVEFVRALTAYYTPLFDPYRREPVNWFRMAMIVKVSVADAWLSPEYPPSERILVVRFAVPLSRRILPQNVILASIYVAFSS